MKPHSLARYRAMDLFLFAVMAAVFESLIYTASVRWFPGSAYTVSVTPLITAIVLIRWGPWAGLHAALGGLVLCILSEAAPLQYAVYILGNLASLLSLPLLPLFGGKEEITNRSGKALLFGLLVLALMQSGRALISIIFGASPAAAAGFFTTESVTDLFTQVSLWIVRRLDVVLEDQLRYLRRVQEEQNSEA